MSVGTAREVLSKDVNGVLVFWSVVGQRLEICELFDIHLVLLSKTMSCDSPDLE